MEWTSSILDTHNTPHRGTNAVCVGALVKRTLRSTRGWVAVPVSGLARLAETAMGWKGDEEGEAKNMGPWYTHRAPVSQQIGKVNTKKVQCGVCEVRPPRPQGLCMLSDCIVRHQPHVPGSSPHPPGLLKPYNGSDLMGLLSQHPAMCWCHAWWEVLLLPSHPESI